MTGAVVSQKSSPTCLAQVTARASIFSTWTISGFWYFFFWLFLLSTRSASTVRTVFPPGRARRVESY